MSNVYIEPRPRARDEGDPIEYYVILGIDGAGISKVHYKTQKEAIASAKDMGFHPLVARVRKTEIGHPDHWRSAD